MHGGFLLVYCVVHPAMQEQCSLCFGEFECFFSVSDLYDGNFNNDGTTLTDMGKEFVWAKNYHTPKKPEKRILS